MRRASAGPDPSPRGAGSAVAHGTGRTVDRVSAARLCRCGHSRDKPYCDGSHALAGSSAAGD